MATYLPIYDISGIICMIFKGDGQSIDTKGGPEAHLILIANYSQLDKEKGQRK
jgi:hypothetical protein